MRRALRRHVYAARRCRTARAIDLDAPASGGSSPAIDVDERRLARARPAEQRRTTGVGRESRRRARIRRSRCCDVDRRSSSAPQYAGTRGATATRRRPGRRATARPRSRSRRSAGASPPGTCVQRVDRERQRARLARNVRDERDGGAELAEACARTRAATPARMPGSISGSVT